MGLAVALPFLLLIACAAPRPPTARPLPDDDPRPAALVQSLVREGALRHALRGVAKLAIDGPNGSGRARQIVVAARPERLRVEVLGLLDQTLALLVTDGARYRVVRSEDRSVERGAVHDALLAEVAGIEIAPARAVELLLAAPAGADTRVIGGAALDDGGVRAILAPRGGLEREVLDFDADARLRRWARLGADGEPLLEAVFGDWRDAGGLAFPHALALTDRAREASARIEWSSVELDPPLSPDLFAVGGAP